MSRVRDSAGIHLVLSAGEGGVTVTAIGGERRRSAVAGRDDLVVAISDVLRGAKPEGVFVAGVAERFSESRSLSTVASVLAYAWGVKAGSSDEPLPEGVTAGWVRAKIGRGRWPLAPAYSGKPNITKPRSHKKERAR